MPHKFLLRPYYCGGSSTGSVKVIGIARVHVYQSRVLRMPLEIAVLIITVSELNEPNVCYLSTVVCRIIVMHQAGIEVYMAWEQ